MNVSLKHQRQLGELTVTLSPSVRVLLERYANRHRIPADTAANELLREQLEQMESA